MFTEEYLEKIRGAIPMTQYLEYSPKSKMYCCPFCGSGHGKEKTGAFKYYPETNTGACFASCKEAGEEGHSYNLIDVVGQVKGLDFVESVKHIAEEAGLPIEEEDSYNMPVKREISKREEPKRKPNTPEKYKAFIKSAAANVGPARDYLHSRGLSDQTIKDYEIGYTEQYFSGAIVLPYNKDYSYFIARSIEGKHFYKPNTEEAGEEPLYNPEALHNGKPCFVCESALDALSIIEAGGNACALSGTAYGKLWPELSKKSIIILSFDNDKPEPKTGKKEGEAAQYRLAAELREKGIPYTEAKYNYAKYSGPKKDANDLLRSNAGQLKKDVGSNIAIIEDSTGIESFLFDISTEKYKPIKTGLESIDKLLSGGFLPQTLNILGGPPASGKSMLASEIMESLVKSGRLGVYFNFEMSREQMIARSLSRRVFLRTEHTVRLKAIDILQGYRLTEQDLLLVQEAAQEYKEKIGNKLVYNPAGISPKLSEITEYLETIGKRQEEEGKPGPIICLDYLHLVQGEAGEDVKETIKKTTTALKEYAIKYNTVVLAIMAQNRSANVSDKARLESGRDSSSIEYGADTIMQLVQKESDPKGTEHLCVTKSRFSRIDTEGTEYKIYGDVSYFEA